MSEKIFYYTFNISNNCSGLSIIAIGFKLSRRLRSLNPQLHDTHASSELVAVCLSTSESHTYTASDFFAPRSSIA